MRTPADLVDWAAKRFASGHRRWIAGSPGGPAAGDCGLRLAFPTDPPSEAVVASDPAAAATWVQGWAAFERGAPPGVSVEWATRRWRGFGEQRLPVRVRVVSPAAVAWLAGEADAWQSLSDRADQLRAAWPDLAGLAQALPGLAGKLSRLAAPELPRLIAVVNWFLANPESGLLARQLPVEGVDTKWLERHGDIVRRLTEALGGNPGLGLRVEPRRFRLRLLDGSGLADFTAAVADLSALVLSPASVLIVENQACVSPLPHLPGVVAVHGQGLAAPELAVVPWLRRSRILYWGDLDSHGFRILGMVRQVLPQVESILMDRATLERFAALAIGEPAPYRGAVGHLTPDENEVLGLLRGDDLRLEQERIPWDYAVGRLEVALLAGEDHALLGHRLEDEAPSVQLALDLGL